MRSSSAALGTTAFFAVPLTVGGLLPWLIGQAGPAWQPTLAEAIVGWAFVVAGTVGLLDSFVRFVRDGRGTPAPVAPTERLVVTGFYRYVRNPMYDFVLLVILGQALLLRSPAVLGYAVCFVAFVGAFVLLYEEPTLRERHGQQYVRYCAVVPRWLPRPGRVWTEGREAHQAPLDR